MHWTTQRKHFKKRKKQKKSFSNLNFQTIKVNNWQIVLIGSEKWKTNPRKNLGKIWGKFWKNFEKNNFWLIESFLLDKKIKNGRKWKGKMEESEKRKFWPKRRTRLVEPPASRRRSQTWAGSFVTACVMAASPGPRRGVTLESEAIPVPGVTDTICGVAPAFAEIQKDKCQNKWMIIIIPRETKEGIWSDPAISQKTFWWENSQFLWHTHETQGPKHKHRSLICHNSLRLFYLDYEVSAVRNVTFADRILHGNIKWSTPFGAWKRDSPGFDTAISQFFLFFLLKSGFG